MILIIIKFSELLLRFSPRIITALVTEVRYFGTVYLLIYGRQNLLVTLVIYSTHFILLGNFCIFRHGIHVKQFLWFYVFWFWI